MRAWVLFAIVAAATFGAEAEITHNKVVCYIGTWAVYRLGKGKFVLEDIDTSLCTHYVYAFVGITAKGGVKVLDPWLDLPGNLDGFRQFTGLRAKNPDARFMVGIGGWNEGSTKFSNVMNDPALRATFIDNVIKFMKEYKFDGFDLDWEYPCQRGGKPYDKENYVSLIKEMRPRFDAEGYVLSAAVAAGVESVDTSYDVPNVSKYLDFINVMAYDLHGPWETVAGQNAPLFASSIDVSEAEKTLNVKAAIEHWIKRGADPGKLVLGMGTYGHSFNLATEDSSLGAPISGAAKPGPYSEEEGTWGYNEICEMQMNEAGWVVTWDDEQKVPIAVKNREWVGYDNVRSITEKVKFAMEMGLGGGMIWSMETDDFKNVCGGGKNPLLTTISQVLNGGSVTTTTGKPTTTDPDATTVTTIPTTKPTTTTHKPPPHDICTEEGYVRDTEDCATFYYCQLENGAFTVYEYHCDPPLVFDNTLLVCNYPENVQC